MEAPHWSPSNSAYQDPRGDISVEELKESNRALSDALRRFKVFHEDKMRRMQHQQALFGESRATIDMAVQAYSGGICRSTQTTPMDVVRAREDEARIVGLMKRIDALERTVYSRNQEAATANDAAASLIAQLRVAAMRCPAPDAERWRQQALAAMSEADRARRTVGELQDELQRRDKEWESDRIRAGRLEQRMLEDCDLRLG
ncbi:hypothetical protein J8273_5927 [Carpediemonas membranifera]|uniref:Uncharacterized protein n=1 Tax=Carpediemonas membranifera TaxID=201153 RepID=A0A8J6B491_9EUKA|nr:hypothetical protein J8273_5927 [Carpediemonas membranifera]|eukprot:KAG9392669.1 hypothetical protein J8273_5927 [Carpediemonas membranifera]